MGKVWLLLLERCPCLFRPTLILSLPFVELNHNIMCTLFITFIKLSKKLLSYLIRPIWPTYDLKWHILGLCLKTFLRHTPTYSIKYVLFNVCVGRRKYNALLHVHKNTLSFSSSVPLCFKVGFTRIICYSMLHSHRALVYFHIFIFLSCQPIPASNEKRSQALLFSQC